MLLRNKKTGEVREVEPITIGGFRSLAELNEDWEDYEDEPKEYWYIYGNQVLKNECDGVIEDRFKEIGNYFETREEAKKAVEKLKAWKRLRDNHFKFLNIKNVTPDVPIDKNYVHIEATFDATGLDDLKLIFGGEE